MQTTANTSSIMRGAKRRVGRAKRQIKRARRRIKRTVNKAKKRVMKRGQVRTQVSRKYQTLKGR